MRLLSLLLLLLAVMAVGCRRGEKPVPPPPPPPPPTAWQQGDSAKAADDIAGEAIKLPWVNEFRDQQGRVPVLRIGQLNDRSDGEVDIKVLAGELARALSVSNRIRLAEIGTPVDFILVGTVGFQEAQQGTVRYYQIDLKIMNAKGEPVGAPLSIERSKRLVDTEAPGKTK